MSFNYFTQLIDVNLKNSFRCHARIKLDPRRKFCALVEIHNHLPMVEIQHDNMEDVADRICIMDTKRGGHYVILDGFKFIKCDERGQNVKYRCTNYTDKCKCRLQIFNGKVIKSNDHNHVSQK